MDRLSRDEWLAKGKELFGPDMKCWRWVCLACGNVQSAAECLERNPSLDLDEMANWMYFSCEGRRTKGRGCNWTLGGLFTLHEREVYLPDAPDEATPVFLFYGETSSVRPFYTPRQDPPTKERPHDR